MERGGTQRQILEMLRHLDTEAFEAELLYFRMSSPWVDELRARGVRVTRIDKRHRLDPLFLFRLCRFLRRGRFDVIHAFAFSAEVWICLANLLVGHARLVSSVRGMYLWYGGLQWTLKRWVTRHSAAVVANSHAGAEYAALQMGLRKNRFDVVYNSVPPLPATREAAKRRAAPRLLFVGRLDPVKNLSCLLRAVERLRASGCNAVLDLVGEGAERAPLEREIRQRGLGSAVVLHGEQAAVDRFLARAHLFVLCSHCEGLSNAVMEAMSAGLPVVASNVGGNAELIAHGRTGLLFPPDDDEALAALLQELLASPARRKALGVAAREFIGGFQDGRHMSRQLSGIYERCLAPQPGWQLER